MLEILSISAIGILCIIGLIWVMHSSYQRHNQSVARWEEFVKAHNLCKSITIPFQGVVVDACKIRSPTENFGLYEFSFKSLGTIGPDIELAANRVVLNMIKYYYIVRLDYLEMRQSIEQALSDHYEDIKITEEIWHEQVNDLIEYCTSFEQDIMDKRGWYNYTFGCKVPITKEEWEIYKENYSSVTSTDDLPCVQVSIAPFLEGSEFELCIGKKKMDAKGDEGVMHEDARAIEDTEEEKKDR